MSTLRQGMVQINTNSERLKSAHLGNGWNQVPCGPGKNGLHTAVTADAGHGIPTKTDVSICLMCSKCSPCAKERTSTLSFHPNYNTNHYFFFFFFLLFVRWKLRSPRWRWQYTVGPPGYRRACELRECGLARFPFWAGRRGGRTAVDALLSDYQYRKGTALYGRCRVWNAGDGWGGCGLFWAWILSLVPVWFKGSRVQSCCILGARTSTCCVAWPWGCVFTSA